MIDLATLGIKIDLTSLNDFVKVSESAIQSANSLEAAVGKIALKSMGSGSSGGLSETAKAAKEAENAVKEYQKTMEKSQSLASKTNLRTSFNEQKEAIRQAADEAKSYGKVMEDSQNRAMKTNLRVSFNEQKEAIRQTTQEAKKYDLSLQSLNRQRSSALISEFKQQAVATRQAQNVIDRYAGSVRTLDGIQEHYRLELEKVRQAYALTGGSAERLQLAERNLGDIRDQQIARWKAYNSQITGTGEAAQFSRHHLINLGYQLQDIIVGITSGQRLGVVAVQQGSQIAGIAQSANVGMVGLLGAVGRLALAYTPLIAAVGGGYAALEMFKSSLNDQAGFDSYIKSLGLSADEMKQFESNMKDLGGTTVNTGDIFRGLFKTLDDYFGTTQTFTSWKDTIITGFNSIANEATYGVAWWYATAVAMKQTMDDMANPDINLGDVFNPNKQYRSNFNKALNDFYKFGQDVSDNVVMGAQSRLNEGLIPVIDKEYVSSTQKAENDLEKINREHNDRLKAIRNYAAIHNLDMSMLRNQELKEQEYYTSEIQKYYDRQQKAEDAKQRKIDAALRKQEAYQRKLEAFQREQLSTSQFLNEIANKTGFGLSDSAFTDIEGDITKLKQLMTKSFDGQQLLAKSDFEIAVKQLFQSYKNEYLKYEAELSAKAAQIRLQTEMTTPSWQQNVIDDYKSLYFSTRTDAEKTDALLKSQLLTLETMVKLNPKTADKAADIGNRLRQNANPYYSQGAGAVDKLKQSYIDLEKAQNSGYITNTQYTQGMRDLYTQELQLSVLRGENLDGSKMDGFEAFGSGLELYAASFKGTFVELQEIGQNFASSLGDGISDAFARSIVQGESFRESMYSLSQTVMTELVGSLIRMGLQYTLNSALGVTSTATTTAAQIAAMATINGVAMANLIAIEGAGLLAASTLAAAWLPAATAVSLATAGGNSVGASAGITATTAVAKASLLATSVGFKEGGYTGSAARDQIAGVVHGQEYVLNARATSEYRPLLEAMNSGRKITPTDIPAPSYQSSGSGASSGNSKPMNVQVINNAPGVEFQTNQLSESDVQIIAERAVAKNAPKVVAASLANPNSVTSKSFNNHYKVGRKH